MLVTAAVMEEKSGMFRLDSLDLDAPRRDEVPVKISATSICDTDLHARDGYFAVPYPAVYGHKGAGVVTEVGSAVEHLAAINQAAADAVSAATIKPLLRMPQ